MLVLTRKVNQTLCIGDSVEVTILKVDGSQVKIGIEAPHMISVDRKEVREQKLEKGET